MWGGSHRKPKYRALQGRGLTAGASCRDLTEASMTGAGLSIVATVVMGLLLVFEFRAFLTPERVTDMTVDTVGSDLIRLDFDISFPKMPCNFASVELSDNLGTVRPPSLTTPPLPPPLRPPLLSHAVPREGALD